MWIRIWNTMLYSDIDAYVNENDTLNATMRRLTTNSLSLVPPMHNRHFQLYLDTRLAGKRRTKRNKCMN